MTLQNIYRSEFIFKIYFFRLLDFLEWREPLEGPAEAAAALQRSPHSKAQIKPHSGY